MKMKMPMESRIHVVVTTRVTTTLEERVQMNFGTGGPDDAPLASPGSDSIVWFICSRAFAAKLKVEKHTSFWWKSAR